MNIKKILLAIIIIIGIVIVAVYLMGMWGPTKPVADAVTGLGNQAVDYVKGNIPTVVAAGGTVTAIGGAALSKVNSANQKAAEVSTNANSQITGLLGEKDKLEGMVESQKTQITTLQDQVTQASTIKTEAEQKLAEVQKENERLQAIVDNAKETEALAKAMVDDSRFKEATTPIVP